MRAHFFFVLKIIVLLSVRSIGHLKTRQFSSSLGYCNSIILGGHILNISKTLFTKLIFHLRLSHQVNEAISQEFYINPTSVINFCIVNIKINCQFLVGHIHVSKFTFIKVGFEKKKLIFPTIKSQSAFFV